MTLDTRIGPYQIVGKLGEGGMGVVYEARHETLARRVAIKIMKASFASNPELVERFFNEAQAVNVIDHPGLVQVSDCGQLADGSAYLVMEFIDGRSLGSRLKELGGPMPVEEALHISRQVAEALAAAHEKNIVHRDLKPDNIMLMADAAMLGGVRTKLLDFGVAKVLSPQPTSGFKTKTNALLGTPVYMSPEQCRGAKHVDGKSDVYSLGVLLFRMLAGMLPFTGRGPAEIIGKHIYEPPPPIARLVPRLPAPLVELVNQLLAKDKDSRPSMSQVAARLKSIFADELPLSQVQSSAVSAAPTVRHSVVKKASVAHCAEAQTVAGLGPVSKTPLSTAKVVLARNRTRRLFWLGGLVVLLAGALVGLLIQRSRALAPTTAVPASPRSQSAPSMAATR